ncbi:MAG TPA: polyprenol monophosphomannose synthase [Ktedonobacterales bacterium]|nr:polyprenol monophosphomannose synthase [Ktedonobacterales bacterium]
MKALIVMPTYNERENITSIVEEIQRYVPQVDMLIIDDNSPDGTGEIADALHQRFPNVSALHRMGKLGLGTAYIAGFRYALEHDYELVFEMDADFSHDPRYLPDLLAEAEHADLVIGSRYVRGGGTPNWSPLRRFISGGGNIFARIMLGLPIKDATAGYRCYRSKVLAALDLGSITSQGYAFQVEMAYQALKHGFTVHEVPIIFVDRRVGKSKMSRKIFIEGFVYVLRARFGRPRKPMQTVTAARITEPLMPSSAPDEQLTTTSR